MQEISRPKNSRANLDSITNALEDALLDAVVQRHFEFLSWHYHNHHDNDDDGEGSSRSSVARAAAYRKTLQDIEKKKLEMNRQRFWQRIQKTSFELIGVALSILFSYAVNSALQRRHQHHLG
jgi:hypothetical protein